MNVYDFDGTIYDGDSSIDFYLFCIKKKPSIFWKHILIQLPAAVLFKIRLLPRRRFKEIYFRFLNDISVDGKLLDEFWDEKYACIKEWYLKQKQPDDVIISASPEFLLHPVCKRLNVSLIASQVNASTGRFEGENCRGEEKVRRFRERFPDGAIDGFYTDSSADMPLMRIAEKAFYVKGENIYRFRFDEESKG